MSYPHIYQLIRPFSTEYILSAILIVDCLCDTSTTVLSSLSFASDLSITASLRLSKLLVGSSKSTRSEL